MERVGAGVEEGEVTVPGGRFAQWKAVLRRGGAGFGGAELSGEEPGAGGGRCGGAAGSAGRGESGSSREQTVQVSFPAAAAGAGVQVFTPDANAQPLMAQKDKDRGDGALGRA
jgi:hypothetical protein